MWTPEVLVQFSTTVGSTTIKTTLYKRPMTPYEEERRPWIEAEEIQKAKREAQHRAEQLEPVRKVERAPREPHTYIGHAEAELMENERPRNRRRDRVHSRPLQDHLS